MGSSFFVRFCFLREEREPDYRWALSSFVAIVQIQPLVSVTDRELALTNAIDSVFSDACNLLYVWYINKNVLSICKKLFATGEGW